MSTVTLFDLKQPRNIITLVVFLMIVIGVGAFIGTQTAPGTWYAALEKPPFNPPNWIFGPVWFTLYVLIAIAGWRTFQSRPVSRAMMLWIAQMVLNWLWSPAFFLAQNLWLALAIIVPMLAVIIGYILVNWRVDRLSSWLFVPYAAWVSFATVLNISLVLLNA